MPKTQIGLTPITIPGGRLFRPDEIRRAIRNIMEDRAKAVRVDFRVTTQTWKNKPRFVIQRPKWNIRIVGTDSDIYKFIDKGTRIRYAVMTPDFQAKTRVKVIQPRAGKGGFSRFDFKRPRPGIEAREFSETIRDKWAKLLPRQIERAILQELPTK